MEQESLSRTRAYLTDSDSDATVTWLEAALPRIMRRLLDSENLDMPILQLPLAQLRLANALYSEAETENVRALGETMGRLSQKLGVRQNALTQAADRLINHGLAERNNDPQDRRIVRMRLTTMGWEWVHARRSRRRARIESLWTLLSETERSEFLAAIQTLESACRRLKPQPESSGEPLCECERQVPIIEETLSRFTAGAERESD